MIFGEAPMKSKIEQSCKGLALQNAVQKFKLDALKLTAATSVIK